MYPVVILTGGLATRLHPLTKIMPKSLLLIAGKPFIEWQLDLLYKQGMKNIYICVGHMGNKINEYFKSKKFPGLNIKIFFDGKNLLGTGGAINKIQEYLPRNFFVLYGDTYLPIDYNDVLTFYKNQKDKSRALMTIYKNNGKFDKSNVIYENNKIIKYSKNFYDKKMQYIEYGLNILSKDLFKTYQRDDIFDLSDLFEKQVKMNMIDGYEVFERFYEIGTPGSLSSSEKYLKGLK